MRSKININILVTVAVLIACEIILTRFLSVNLQFLRIGFGFLPVAVTAILYGPIWAAAAYAVGDVLGSLIFPTGPYFPGFTLSAVITGIIYGLFLYNKEITWRRCALCAVCIAVTVTLGLNTLWLSILYGKGYIAILMGRFAEAAVLAVIQSMLIPLINRLVIEKLPSSVKLKR